jgi:uncharacterized membrane protein YeiH
MINKVPAVLVSDFYGSVALIVAVLLILSNALWNLNTMSIAIISIFAISLRLLAYIKQWHLPTLEIK